MDVADVVAVIAEPYVATVYNLILSGKPLLTTFISLLLSFSFICGISSLTDGPCALVLIINHIPNLSGKTLRGLQMKRDA